MKKQTLFIGIAFIILFLPMAYYYGYAKPHLEREKFEYQKRQDQELKDKKAQEEYDKRVEENEKKQNYDNCIKQADIEYNNTLISVCEASYKLCVENVDSYNALWLTYYPKKTYDECEKFKFNYEDNSCMFYEQFNKGREENYKTALDKCERLYN